MDKQIHIDEWLDNSQDHDCPVFQFFEHKRSPASFQYSHPIKTKLFATYQGKEYRIIGASRLGDVYLTTDFNRDVGYEKRGVFINELSNFRVTT